MIDILYKFLSIFDTESLIRNGGLLLVLLVVYGSTGLFFCFFLPSGAVLFTAGVFTATGELKQDIFTICSLLIIASVLGNLTGYGFGWKTGQLLYSRKDSRLFRRKYLVAADIFYKKHGWLALTLGLYLPIIRTFAPVVAGIIRMNFRHFILFTSLGSVIWILGFVLSGYFIGNISFLKSSVKYIALGFILVITLPLLVRIIRELRKKEI